MLLLVPLGCDKAPPRARNLLLVSFDTLRSDHLGCYGYRPATSPNIDAFCREAVVFERTTSNAPSTLLSHASLFTSKIPQHNGVSHLQQRPLRPDIPTLTAVLRSRGWATAAVVGGGQLAPEFGLDQGFEQYVVQYGRFAQTVEKGLGWLDRRDGRPFFLFLHTYEVHHPYEPNAPDLALLDQGYEGPLPTTISIDLLRQINAGEVAIDDADRAHIVAAYDAGIRDVDRAFGDLMTGLRSRRLLDDTAVAVVSDHGEEFGEHGWMGWHSHSLYRELLRVPWIVRLPQGSRAGTRVALPVQLLDAAPTLLDWLGVAAPSGFEGSSLVPLVTETSSSDSLRLRRLLRRRPEIAWRDTGPSGESSVALGNWKLIGDALFDLARDPGERHDVATQFPERVLDLRRLLRGAPVAAAQPMSLTDETEQQLKALGYLTPPPEKGPD